MRLTKNQKVERANTALKHATARRSECEAAESDQYDAMQRQPSSSARVEWMRRLDALSDALLDEGEARAAVAEANALPEEAAPAVEHESFHDVPPGA